MGKKQNLKMNGKSNGKSYRKIGYGIRIGGVAVLMAVLLSASGCTRIFQAFLEEPSSQTPYFPTENSSENPPSSLPEPDSSEKPSEPGEDPGEEIFPDWTAPEPMPDYSKVVPEISDDGEFNHYMNYILENRIMSFDFYAKDGFSINNDVLLYRFSLPYVSTYCTETEDGDYWHCFIEYYPGTKIADAYETGKFYGLTEEELEVAQMAVDFVENTVNPEPDVLVKERLIHDFICESTVYTNPGSNDPIPRYCTAVGLFLDGEANCQGYADAFNMLGRMAGLDVRSQSGSAGGSLHVWNIIKIDRKWYSMDVTYDDTTFNGEGYYHPAYIYFNAGKDILWETHSVPEANELIHVAEYSDLNYFYYSGTFADAGYSVGAVEASQYEEDLIYAQSQIAKLLEDAYLNGYEYVSYLVRGRILYSGEIVNPIQSYIPGEPNPITVSTYQVGKNTYICGVPE